MERPKEEAIRKVAEVLVQELGTVARVEALVEAGHRFGKFDPGLAATFGFGCGGNCDAWGFACGNNCLQGLDRDDWVINSRMAIDVLGEKLTADDMAVFRASIAEVSKAAVGVLVKRLDPATMEARIAKYG
jgi:hypothetical protein